MYAIMRKEVSHDKEEISTIQSRVQTSCVETNDHEKRYNSIHQQKNLLNVLHRPIEIAADSSPSQNGFSSSLNDCCW